MRMRGKAAVVTGAASGIGSAVSKAFYDAGSSLILIDKNDDGLKERYDSYGFNPERTLLLTGDCQDNNFVYKIPSMIEEKFPIVDVLFNGAGISEYGQLKDFSDEKIDLLFSVNVASVIRLTKVLIPLLERGAGSSIINVASQLAYAGAMNRSVYAATKGAMISFTRALALEYAEKNIRVNCLLPGAIRTAMLKRSLSLAVDPDLAEANSRNRHAMKRFGRPEEVANAAVFLASDESSFVTGAEITVDGGWLVA